MVAKKQLKEKSCKHCKRTFYPRNSLQKVCGTKCAYEYQKAEKEAKQLRERKDKLKTRKDFEKLAQIAFNGFIRERDFNEPCISCGRHHQGQYHAGHYRTVGACPELRFDESNCHKQCSVCNNHKSGNLVEYRLNLIKKIGEQELARIEGSNPALKLDKTELIELAKSYRKKARELKKLREAMQ